MNTHNSTAHRIHDFFEKPKGFWAYLVQFVIFLLIIGSIAQVVGLIFYEAWVAQHQLLFKWSETIILGAFTVEYVLRVGTARHKWQFSKKPLSIIDFFAIFPSYLEFFLPFFLNFSALRALRLLRLLRALKFLKYGRTLQRVLRYKATILQAITPIIILFIVLKGIIWGLESYGFWVADASLGELFAIIGFALGIILSQKIAVSYDKFLQVEEAVVRLYGTLNSLALILDKLEPESGKKVTHEWATTFLNLLTHPTTDSKKIHQANAKLYQSISKAEDSPAEMAILHGDICRDAAFCLSKKTRLTPKAYDTLLHQSTMLYLTLIIIFLPGWAGIISVVVATYILYGMYNLTQDLDSILGGEFDLINIDISELKMFVREGNFHI